MNITLFLFLISLESVKFRLSSKLLSFVLVLLFETTAFSDLLLNETSALKSGSGLELGQRILVVVDQTESGGSAASEFGLEAEQDDVLGCGLELFGDCVRDFLLRRVREVWAENINHELLSV